MQIDENHVRERAYHIWESEGRVHGRAAAHWIRAEAELVAVATPAAVAAPRKGTSKPSVKVAKPTARKAAPEVAVPRIAAPRIAAPKPAKASKAAVSAGVAAKAKPARAATPLH